MAVSMFSGVPPPPNDCWKSQFPTTIVEFFIDNKYLEINMHEVYNYGEMASLLIGYMCA